MTTPVDLERSILEQKLKATNRAIDQALDSGDREAFVRARGLRMQLLSRLAKTHDS